MLKPLKNNLLLMLIERRKKNMSYHTVSILLAKNVPLKAVVFSKVFVPGFLLQPLLVFIRWQQTAVLFFFSFSFLMNF